MRSRLRRRSVPSRCASLTGASSVRVVAGEPGSRSPTSTDVDAGCQKPRGGKPPQGKQERGPQHQLKPAASLEKQWEGRAGHVAAKAIVDGQAPDRPSILSGVWGAARVHREARNTREPSASSSSRHSAPYKPKAKSGVAQRKSEGVIVPLISTTKNAEGGRDPCSGHVGGEGKREGMSGLTETIHPVGAYVDVTKARQLPNRLWSQAKLMVRREMIRGGTERSDARFSSEIAAPPSTQAWTRRPPASRVREIRMHGLKGGPETLLLTHVPRKELRIYQ
jgi:hypothetical protein